MKHCSLSKHCNYGQYCDRFVYLLTHCFIIAGYYVIFDLGPIWYAKKNAKMIHSVEKIKFVTKENVSQAVQQIATAKREKNVIIKNVFVLVKMVDIVQKTAIAILMIKFVLNGVFLIGIVLVATNVQMGIALCLAANQVNVPILDNTAMSKY